MRARLLLLVVGCLMTVPAFGQLSLTASTPAHGQTEVSTTVTLTLSFSAPLDADVVFGDTETFLAYELIPDAGLAPALRLSADGLTVEADVSLDDDTVYHLLLTGAVGIDGAALDRPYAVTFSTGSTLPTATVSGTVTTTDGEAFGTFVGLIPAEAGLTGDGDPVAIGVVTASNGAYTVEFVPEGAYIVLGVRDLDQSGTIDFGQGDAFGVMDANADALADVVAVSEGAAVTGVDLVVDAVRLTTARTGFENAQAFALATFADAEPTFVTGSVDAAGRSGAWAYGFRSVAADTLFDALVLNGVVLPGSGTSGDFEAVALPADWIDSDAAMAVAEAHGGADFRAANPDVEVLAGLTTLTDLSGDIAVWFFFYFSEVGFINVVVDAVTGAPLGLGTTAAANLASAEAAAAAWMADAVLVEVAEASFLGIDAAGLSQTWSFSYYSAATRAIQTFFIEAGRVVGEGTSLNVLFAPPPLPAVWIDSDEAAAVAEAHGGAAFRAAHAEVFVFATLATDVLPADPARAVWQFAYFADGDFLALDIDAETGAILTGTETEPGVPDAFALGQNYPNPFATDTTIPFTLDQPTPVRLVVFDALGREVATLHDGPLPTGHHVLRWDAAAHPAGLYLYRLTTGARTATGTMMRVR